MKSFYGILIHDDGKIPNVRKSFSDLMDTVKEWEKKNREQQDEKKPK
jgi:hypothetical protein